MTTHFLLLRAQRRIISRLWTPSETCAPRWSCMPGHATTGACPRSPYSEDNCCLMSLGSGQVLKCHPLWAGCRTACACCGGRFRGDEAKQARATADRARQLLPHPTAAAADAAGQQPRRRSAEAAHKDSCSSDDGWEVVETYPAAGPASAVEEAEVRSLVEGERMDRFAF